MKKLLFAIVLAATVGLSLAQVENTGDEPVILRNVRVTVTAAEDGQVSKIELIKPDGEVILVKLDDNGKMLVGMRDQIVEVIGLITLVYDKKEIEVQAVKPAGIPPEEIGS